MGDRAARERQEDLPAHGSAVEGAVLGAAVVAGLAHGPLGAEIDEHDVGGCARFDPRGGQVEQRRSGRHALNEQPEADDARDDKLGVEDGEGRLQPDRAHRRLLERHLLLLTGVRSVVGRHAVDGSVAQRRDQGRAVGLGAQRRIDLQRRVESVEDDLARQLTSDKMESALANSIVVSPKAAEDEYRRGSENARIRYVLYSGRDSISSIKVTPAEVQAYYNANQSKYTHGEQRELKYLVADTVRMRMGINPTEKQIHDRYEATKEQFKRPEQARILHILIKPEPKATPEKATPEQLAVAKAKAEGIVKQLRAGGEGAVVGFRALSGPAEAHVHVDESDDESRNDGQQDPLQLVETFPH